ncbi:hypothetical protein BGX38DRAFT_1229501 [Terfezia claveryi]|nr:hypothetical protein BGX38DRAFT_1229501 [Terfezia claveryi]
MSKQDLKLSTILHWYRLAAEGLSALMPISEELQKRDPNYQQGDETVAMLEELRAIQQHGERKLKELKDLSKRESGEVADMIEALESILETLDKDIRSIAGVTREEKEKV